jgi:uncharacterized damage-inducible protein DinB
MSMSEMLIRELEMEAQTTERVLARVPGDKLGWKPHDKSWSLAQLALHVAIIPGAIAELATRSPFVISEFKQAPAATSAELVPTLRESVAKARAIVQGMDDAALARTWRATSGDRDVMVVPVGVFLRSVMLNHWYHHRGQLSVYLRELGVPVPSIYGPSADENPFAAAAAPAA